MKIVKLIVSNYRGIKDSTEITFNDFTCIVGKNDVGKSTILKAIDAFLNDSAISIFDKNYESESNLISIDIVFDNANVEIELDDTIKTSDDVEKYLGLSTLALIPLADEENTSRKKKRKKSK